MLYTWHCNYDASARLLTGRVTSDDDTGLLLYGPLTAVHMHFCLHALRLVVPTDLHTGIGRGFGPKISLIHLSLVVNGL